MPSYGELISHSYGFAANIHTVSELFDEAVQSNPMIIVSGQKVTL